MRHPKSCLIVAGEKSGEEHCLSFFSPLKDSFPTMDFFGVGGDDMEKLGFRTLYHLNDFGAWGIGEVVQRLPFYRKCLNNILAEVQARNCKVAILIDFQTFNLILAKKLKKKGVEVLYYVAPQAWAWKPWRAKVLQQCVHTLFTILPFEKEWFAQRGVERVQSVVHPVFEKYRRELIQFQDILQERLRLFELKGAKDKVKILLLPGSREFEVQQLLPIFLKVILELRRKFNLEILIVKSPTIKQEIFSHWEDKFSLPWREVSLEVALKEGEICFAASGTVTLATALFEIPTLVCYRASLFTQFVYDCFINYRGPISLANIVLEEEVLPEMLQDHASVYNIKKKSETWLKDKGEYLRVVHRLQKLRHRVVGDYSSITPYITDLIKEVYELS